MNTQSAPIAAKFADYDFCVKDTPNGKLCAWLGKNAANTDAELVSILAELSKIFTVF
jgi:hypothetical protein